MADWNTKKAKPNPNPKVGAGNSTAETTYIKAISVPKGGSKTVKKGC